MSKQEQIKKICHYFAYDFTATNTAKKVNLSRQTINNYYKTLRKLLIETQDTKDHEDLQNFYCKDGFTIKYLCIHSNIIYYLEHNDKAYILNETDQNLKKLYDILNAQIKTTLLSHKKVNTATILYHSHEEEYFVSTYLHCENTLEKFIVSRLKKFHGISKTNQIIHIKESIIRYNHDEEFLFKLLYSSWCKFERSR